MTDKAGNTTGYVVLENYPADSRMKICEDGIVQSLSSWMGTGGNNTPMVMAIGNGQTNQSIGDEVGALNCMHDQQAVMTTASSKPIRRLTPKEAERCQGFPDGWTDLGDWTDENGKTRRTTDANRFKALGNSIAIPFWYWLIKRISEHCEEKTMGSLFSGIGGFDLCWTAVNGDGSVRFSSEIEPFCIAVLKKHFGDEETGEKGDWHEFINR